MNIGEQREASRCMFLLLRGMIRGLEFESQIERIS